MLRCCWWAAAAAVDTNWAAVEALEDWFGLHRPSPRSLIPSWLVTAELGERYLTNQAIQEATLRSIFSLPMVVEVAVAPKTRLGRQRLVVLVVEVAVT